MSKLIDLTGNRFGKLVAVRMIDRTDNKVTKFECCCDCGRIVAVQSRHLKNGHTRSCGVCCRGTHGMSRTPEYGIWKSMIQRCTNSLDKGFIHYGGRGIKVCDRWIESFVNFIDDIGERPSDKHSIDRIDNDGNYCPDNCRWATRFEQDRNRSNNRLLSFNGKTQCLNDWAAELGCHYLKIKHRIDNYGWSIEKSLTTPVNQSRSESKLRELKYKDVHRLTHNGVTKTVREWADVIGITRSTIDRRISRGWSDEKVLTTPGRQVS